MERFPFDQLITFLVFIIIALSQVWTKLREQRQQKKEKTIRRTITRTSPSQTAPKEKRLSDSFDDLFEALGIPPQQTTPPPQQSPRFPIEKIERIENVVKRKSLHPQSEVIEVKPPLPTPTPLLLKKIKKEKLPRLTAWDKTLLPSVSHKKVIRALHNRKQIQQAILLKEILDPPKALASDF